VIGCDEAVKPMLASRIIDGEGIPARIRGEAVGFSPFTSTDGF